MKIKAIAPWFGGKRTLANRIAAELGEHSAFWDIFCGSIALLMAKPLSSFETVNDLHGDLINLARVIRDPILGSKLYRRLRRTWCAEQLHREAAEVVRSFNNEPARTIPDIDRAYSYFLSAWLGRNGVAGTQSYNQGFCRRFTKNGGHAAKRFASAIDSIPAWQKRMRSVTILSDNAFDLLPRIKDANGVVLYIDAPYVKKGASYIHDFSPANHVRLAELLRGFTKTRVVVSYYDHTTVRELYDGWTFVSCPTTKAMANQGMRNKSGRTEAPELLIINGPSYTRADHPSLFEESTP